MADYSWKSNPWVWVVSFKVLSTTGRTGVAEVEKPILFSTDMVNAILAGRKTITRRILKPQIIVSDAMGSCWIKPNVSLVQPHGLSIEGLLKEVAKYCPYGKAGDVLWVREKFYYGDAYDYINDEELGEQYIFYAGHPLTEAGDCLDDYKWSPSIHMPKEAARIWLQVTDVRVERLQSITEDDAKAEGWGGFFDSYIPGDNVIGNGPKTWFRKLWDSINGKRKGVQHA